MAKDKLTRRINSVAKDITDKRMIRFGRNPTHYNCPANLYLRKVVTKRAGEYRTSTRPKRSNLLGDVLDHLYGKGYSFIKPVDDEDDSWEYADEKEARMKIGHAFRDVIKNQEQQERSERDEVQRRQRTTTTRKRGRRPKRRRTPQGPRKRRRGIVSSSSNIVNVSKSGSDKATILSSSEGEFNNHLEAKENRTPPNERDDLRRDPLHSSSSTGTTAAPAKDEEEEDPEILSSFDDDDDSWLDTVSLTPITSAQMYLDDWFEDDMLSSSSLSDEKEDDDQLSDCFVDPMPVTSLLHQQRSTLFCPTSSTSKMAASCIQPTTEVFVC